jgi:lysozyme
MKKSDLETQLAIDEGKRLAAYLDSVGILTVGIGHNCVARPVAGVKKVGDTISEDECSDLFSDDLEGSMHDLDAQLPWWRNLDDVRQNVIVNMSFNMGIWTLLQFKNTLSAMKNGDYALAANGMRRSLWAKQVGDRAKRLASQMEAGYQ